MRRFLVVCLLALLLTPSASGWWSSPVVDETTSWLAMRKVSVHCLTAEESALDITIVLGASAYIEGWFDHRGWHPGKYAVYGVGLCETLDALAAGDVSGLTVEDVAWAVLVLTHEAGHLRGHRWSGDEAKTECWAIRHVGYVAYRLGIVDPAARRLIVGYALRWHARLPAPYKRRGCVLPSV